MDLESLRELYRYMEWADARVWERVPAAMDEKLRRTLLHMHQVQRAFLNVWSEQPVVFHRSAEFPELSMVRDWSRPYYAEAREFLERVSEERLREPVMMPWAPEFEKQLGAAFALPAMAETIYQVVSHTTHHRAQVCARLRELGVEPPPVDFIVWVWLGKP